jgi:hypothetical protein
MSNYIEKIACEIKAHHDLQVGACRTLETASVKVLNQVLACFP